MADHLTRPAPTRPRRWARAFIVPALAGAAVLAGPSAMACGCGGVVAGSGTTTSVDREVALLTHDGTTESITMQLSMDSTAEDLGLLVPTPTPATVALGDDKTFDDLSTAARPRRVEDFHLFGPPVLFDSDNESSSGASAPAPAASPRCPRSTSGRWRRPPFGPMTRTRCARGWTSTTTRSGTACRRNSTPYIDEGWTFVAVRLTQEGRALQGELPPIVMSFASGEPGLPDADVAGGVRRGIGADLRAR